MVSAGDQHDRILELDALRGLAVIGIVWMNVYVFALPAQAYYNPTAWGGEHQGDLWVWAASFLFIEDKFRTLFAMLFGAGCAILIERSTDRRWRGHFARMAVLFAIGVVHATLLASNDILRAYAMAGVLIPLLMQLSPRALIAVSVGLLVVHVGGGIVAFGGAMFDWLEGRTSTDLVFFAENNFGANRDAVAFSLEQGREGLGERIDRRVAGFASQFTTLLGSIPVNLAAMALGIAFWKNGLFAARWRLFQMQRLAALCGVLSLPFLIALAWWVSSSGFPGPLVGPVALILSAPADMALGCAYAAACVALFRNKGVVVQHLAAVGRLSLTNYVMTSVILSALFASWGLGLFGALSRAEVFALSFVPISAMLLWSRPWLTWFGQGPLERLWRGSARMLAGVH